VRDKVNVLYYPDMIADPMTLKKVILFFDEIHFMDRPSFSFEGGMGSIGTASPVRQAEHLFRRDNVPIYVHDAPMGPVAGQFLQQVAADVNDPTFLMRFQEGLRTSETFRRLHIARGNYGDIDTQQTYNETEVVDHLCSVDLPGAIGSYGSAMELLADNTVRPFSFSSRTSCLKVLIFNAALCSARMNFALNWGSDEGLTPIADAAPFIDLLGAKYTRAMNKLDPALNHIPVTDLTFAIFDELVPRAVLESMEFPQVIRYRHESRNAREEFLEYVAALSQKLRGMTPDADYSATIGRLVNTEVAPAAQSFRNKMQTISESLVGQMVKGLMTAGAAASGVQILGDLSLTRVLALGAVTSAYVGRAAVDAYLAQRAARRECSLSYVLSLD
jgi:hypothetical protein